MSLSSALPNLFRILSDQTRLRALALLAREELGVSELARILALSPSRLSNHLRILREANLVRDRKEGNWIFVRLHREGVPMDLWDAVEANLAKTPELAQDLLRLEEILEERRARSRSYFDRVAGEWNVLGGDFLRGSARHRVAAQLVPPHLVVADVGCGTGYLSSALAPLVAKVILVDHSRGMLDEARRSVDRAGADLEFRTGEIDELPLDDEEVDALVAGMVLHHAPDLSAFFREAHRVLRPGGILVVEDLLPHREAWLRDSMADLRLGLAPEELELRLAEVGFDQVRVETLEDRYTPERPEGGRAELPLFIMRARRSLPPGGTVTTALRQRVHFEFDAGQRTPAVDPHEGTFESPHRSTPS